MLATMDQTEMMYTSPASEIYNDSEELYVHHPLIAWDSCY